MLSALGFLLFNLFYKSQSYIWRQRRVEVSFVNFVCKLRKKIGWFAKFVIYSYLNNVVYLVTLLLGMETPVLIVATVEICKSGKYNPWKTEDFASNQKRDHQCYAQVQMNRFMAAHDISIFLSFIDHKKLVVQKQQTQNRSLN